MTSTIDDIGKMDEAQRATLTVHVHVSMQAIVIDNMVWPYSEVGSGSTLRLDAQKALKSTYVDPIIEIARMTARAPIVNINHDLRVVGAANQSLKQRAENFHGFHALGAYVALELRVRGCMVVHGSFWSKMACQLKQSTAGVHMLSVDASGDGDEHLRLRRAFAIVQ